MNNRSLLKSRKFRYGAMATAFIAFFLAVMVLFNAVFTIFADKFGWYVDMTTEEVFTFSESSKEFLRDITSDVNIYFATDPDILMANANMKYIYNSAKELASEFSNIKVECHNAIKNPEFFSKFKETKGSEIDSYSVIIESGTESIVYSHRAFFTYNSAEESTPWAYNGEYRFVAGIMQVTQAETPIAYFTTNHGEDVTAANALANLLYDCGFDVRQIDLTAEKIDDDARIIVIFNPQYDFHGYEAESEAGNEIKKIDEFLDGLGGLMVFEDSQPKEDLNNLNEFLEEWGIRFKTGYHVKDEKHSMSTDGYSIKLQYETEDTFGKTVYEDLENFDSMPHTIIRQGMPIEKVWDSKSTMVGVKGVYTMLRSYDTAQLIDRASGDVVDSGEFDLVAISYENRVIDNDYYYSYVMAAGSPSFAYNNYLIDGSWANSDIIFATMKLIGRERVLADLDTKPFDDTSSDATTEEAKNYMIVCTFALPVVIALCGIVVLTRRKHS